MKNNIETFHKETIKNIKFNKSHIGYAFETKETILRFYNIRKIVFDKNKEYQLKIYYYREIFKETACFEYKFQGFNECHKGRFIWFNKILLILYYYYYCKGFYYNE